MICGNCREHHLSVGEVRACYADRRELAFLSASEPGSDLSEPRTALSPTPEPEPPISERLSPATEGFYLHEGSVYKVQRAVHGSGHLYAKRLVLERSEEDRRGTWWVYAKGVVSRLHQGLRLTQEEAAAFGKLYGICCICGTQLNNEVSIERGIGPVCAKKMGWV